MQVVDDASIQSMVSRFKSEAAQPGSVVSVGRLRPLQRFDGRGAGNPAIGVRAVAEQGRGLDLATREARADGAYIKIDLTPDGQQALANGDYHFSPRCSAWPTWKTWATTGRAAGVQEGGPHQRTARMKSIAAPDQCRRGRARAGRIAGRVENSAPADANAGLDNSAQSMKQINLALKLKEDAPESEAVAAITSLMNRAEAADKAALKAKVDGALTKYAGVIANREQAEAALTANYDATVAAFDLVKPAAGKSSTLPNRPRALPCLWSPPPRRHADAAAGSPHHRDQEPRQVQRRGSLRPRPRRQARTVRRPQGVAAMIVSNTALVTANPAEAHNTADNSGSKEGYFVT